MSYKIVLGFARQMRKNPTKAEQIFWNNVLNKKFHGFKFYRQYIIERGNYNIDKYYYIADFYCHKRKTIIEVDGGIHLLQINYDQLREDELKAMGYNIIRFKNEEIIYNWDSVEQLILNELLK